MFLVWTDGLILLAGLGFAAAADLKYRRIPGSVLLILSLLRVFTLATGSGSLMESLQGLLLGGGLTLLCRLLFHGGLGAGDVKLFAVLGLWLGAENVLRALCLTFLIAGAWGGLLLAAGRKTRSGTLPLAPFVWCAVAALWLFGR